MKRLPLFASFLAVLALSASLAFWALKLLKAPQRPISAAPEHIRPEPAIDAAAGLFGGRIVVAAASNYQLRGVIAAGNGRGSVAILAADGKPARTYPAGAEVAPGVTVRDVQPRFVLLLENGVAKRVDLAPDDKSAGPATPQPAMPAMAPQPQPQQPQQQQPQPAAVQMPPPSRVNTVPAPGMPTI